MDLPLCTVTTTRSRIPWRQFALLLPPAFVLGAVLFFRAQAATPSPSSSAPYEERRHLQVQGPEDPPPPSRSAVLQWCLVAILSLGIVAHLALLALIIVHRRAQSVKAAQPVGQALVAFSGAAALAGGIFLVAPPSALACALAEPVILAAVTATGASLAGMAWRVERVVMPILLMGRQRSRLPNEGRESLVHKMKRSNLALLTPMARRSQRFPRGIRQKVTNGSLVRIFGGLVLPQVLLQALVLGLSALRSRPAPGDLCARPSAWPTAVGVLLAILPYGSAVVTTAKVEGGVSVPAFLSERDAQQTLVGCFAFVTVTIAPLLAFPAADADMSTYIRVYLLVGAVLPTTALVVWPKLAPILFSRQQIDVAEQLTVASRARRFSTHQNNVKSRFEKALDLFNQGQIFERMDMRNNSIALYDEALGLWHDDNKDSGLLFTGDFSAAEIQGIKVAKEADLIASTLIAKADFFVRSSVVKAAKCYLKAIEIYEFSPAAGSMPVRSTIYPCFCTLYRLLREGELAQERRFENTLSARFVQETKGAICYHEACALAVSAHMKYRSGLPQEALEEFETMVGIHDVKDSRKIHRACGVDVCALAYSRAALWYKEMGDQQSALKHCDFVIKMLDDLESKDPKEMYAILTPIMTILREKQASRVKTLFEERVVKLVQGTVPAYVRNMHLVLTIDDRSQIEDDISWVLSKNNTGFAEGDRFYTSLGLSANTVASEACLLLAQRCDRTRSSGGRSHFLLIDKGLAFAKRASMRMKEGDDVLSSVANDKNLSVLAALHALCEESDHDWSQGPAMKKLKTLMSFDISLGSKLSGATLQLKTKKTLPHHLLLSHDTVAFVGLTHDSLAAVFMKALSEEPRRKWSSIHIFFVADVLMNNFKQWDVLTGEKDGAQSKEETDHASDLCHRKQKSWQELKALLENKSKELRFYEITNNCSFFGSWFGWRAPGGYIHVSPSIWGVNVKMCPSQSYSWEHGSEPSHEFIAYRKGIENLLSVASPFAIPFDETPT